MSEFQSLIVVVVTGVGHGDAQRGGDSQRDFVVQTPVDDYRILRLP